jgi:pimeloyl-ACP methyl ester carboxylesterase
VDSAPQRGRAVVSQAELSAGTIDDQDTGDGPVVFLHGLMMDASRWDGPVADLPKATLDPLISRRNG